MTAMAVYRWTHLDNGRSVFRAVATAGARKRGRFPCPMIMKDTIEPVRSMANGRIYDSMSALRRTYRADGNPQGQEYTEIGDAPMLGQKPMPRMTKHEVADLLDRSEAMISRGEVPELQSVHDA